ncbi:MAG: hypothetical protein QXH81_08030, partial [Thermofilaceae archaeon]
RDAKTGKWIIYCPKCYAGKRWQEVADKSAWLRSLKAWAKTAEDKARVKLHVPEAIEAEVV